MIDSFGRDINYLRISITKRCNLNCKYCGKKSINNYQELSVEQISKIVNASSNLGINKVRLTGGEPLMRDDIVEIIKEIRKNDKIKTISLTTNGILLDKYSNQLKNVGLDSINISLDTLNNDTYKEITGLDCLENVLNNIDIALNEGFSSIKINSVLMKGRNEKSAKDLINLAKNNKIDVRFIELMPFSKEGLDKNKIVTGQDILNEFPYLYPINTNEQSVAKYYTAENFIGRIGLITPITEKFCSKCNRIRLLADGKIKPCLAYENCIDIMPYIDNEIELTKKIKEAINSKPESHCFNCEYAGFNGMSSIGG